MSEPAGEDGPARAGARHGTAIALDPRPGEPDPVDPAAAARLQPWVARRFGAMPVRLERETLVVAVSDASPGQRLALGGFAGLRVQLRLAPPDAIRRAQQRHYGPRLEGPALPPVRSSATVDGPALARRTGRRWLDLDETCVDPAAAARLGAVLSRRLGMVGVSEHEGTLLVATADPLDAVALRVARAAAGGPLEVVVASPDAVTRALERAFPADAPLPAAAPEELQPLGALLVDAGTLAADELAAALERQRRFGARLGEVLVHARLLTEDELAAALATQLGVPFLDPTRFVPTAETVALVPEALARRRRLLPLSIANHALLLAVTEPLDAATVEELRTHTSLRLEPVLVSPRSLERLHQRVYAERYVEIASTELLNRRPHESAYRVLSRTQKAAGALVLALGVAVAVRHPIGTLIVANALSVAFYSAFSLYKFTVIYHALGHSLELPVTDEDVAALDDADLPVYTILVPLYREAAVVQRLTESLGRLDYPTERLDVKLIVEADDEETIAALDVASLPPQFRLVVVPDATPKTKPKACNFGLIQARGDYVVIYDAEDRPEPDQLRRVVAAYRKAEPRIVCIQCKLNYFNRSQNLLTRWFTTEYSNWFDLLMPGLDASDTPIPLGGTSNHFVRSRLVELGAWDPFNVTEDADLGIRLHKAGYKTAIIDSTTFEEANSDLYNWIRQRSRWVKGYIQTWLVHMRNPVQLLRQLGPRGFLSFQMIIGGTFFSFLLNPLYWLLTTAWALTAAGAIRQIFPGFVFYAAAAGLFLGNFTFTYINVAGAMRRGYHDLVKWALLSPVYWALMSVAAYKGLAQLVYRPFYWEKTEHGLDQLDEARGAA